MPELIQLFAYSGSNVEYIGEANPGTSVASAKWRIKKLVYSGSNVTQILWASGTDLFDKRWSQKATYTYK